MEDINTDYMWMGQISFKKIFNYGRGENISFDVIFLQIGREKGEFQILLDALDKIKTKGKEAPFTHFDPSCLFPACRDYWTYHGSFTTPPCEECIVWLLLKEPMTVSSDQMAKLRSLFSSAENEPPVPLVGNWRPPQPVKGRVVRASFK